MNTCELCQSTWGNFWKIIGKRNLFFCCEICAIQYRGMIQAIRDHSEIKKIDIIEIKGSSRYKTCTILKNEKEYQFAMSFGVSGEILDFYQI